MDRVALRRSLVALGITYSVLWACAPAFMPPPVPMVDGRKMEVGIAGSATLEVGPGDLGNLILPDGHLFFRAHTAPKLDVGVGLFGGGTSFVGVGAWLDWRVLETDRLILGPGIAAGFLYAEASLPIAVRVAPGGWVYTRPRLGLSRQQVPLGFALSLPQGLGLYVEGSVSWVITYDDEIGPVPSASLGVTWQLPP